METCLGKHVEEVNHSLADETAMAGAQIRRFLILHKELDADDGEITRTQKVRRGFIAERYAPLVRALYDGSAEASISTDVTFEDGRNLRIDARSSAGIAAQRLAHVQDWSSGWHLLRVIRRSKVDILRLWAPGGAAKNKKRPDHH
jgi:hypothetical protein